MDWDKVICGTFQIVLGLFAVGVGITYLRMYPPNAFWRMAAICMFCVGLLAFIFAGLIFTYKERQSQ